MKMTYDLGDMLHKLCKGESVCLDRSRARIAMLALERWCFEATADFDIQGSTLVIKPLRIKPNTTGQMVLKARDQKS